MLEACPLCLGVGRVHGPRCYQATCTRCNRSVDVVDLVMQHAVTGEALKPARSQKYMAWIRKQHCVVTNEAAAWGAVIHAHHVRLGSNAGLGQKPSDFRCVPLTAEEHHRLHTQGELSYWQEKNDDPNVLIVSLMTCYLIEEEGLNPRLIIEHLEQLIGTMNR